MKKPATGILALVLTLLLLALCSPMAFAAERGLPDEFLIGDDDGITTGAEGEYFIHVENLEPGDVITKTLTIQNLAPSGVADLYMTMEPVSSTGPAELMDNVSLRLSMDGTTLYEGRIRGDGKATVSFPGNGVDAIQEALILGSYSSGDIKTLQVELRADFAGQGYWTMAEPSCAEFKWVFTAVKKEAPEGPKTGEALRYGLYILLLALLIMSAILGVYRKKLKSQGPLDS